MLPGGNRVACMHDPSRVSCDGSVLLRSMYTYPAQNVITAGRGLNDLDYLDRDLSVRCGKGLTATATGVK